MLSFNGISTFSKVGAGENQKEFIKIKIKIKIMAEDNRFDIASHLKSETHIIN